jgi:hypothetical protein
MSVAAILSANLSPFRAVFPQAEAAATFNGGRGVKSPF